MTSALALNIFWRSFAQQAAGVVPGFLVLDWVNGDKRANAIVVGLGLLGCVIAALVAVGTAYTKLGPAETALQKALRSAVQAIVSGLSAVGIATVADLVALPPVLITMGVGVVGAFVVTFLSYQGAPPVSATPRDVA